MKLISTLFLALSMLAATAPAAENANDLFQQALVKERTEGNLPEAIKLYQRIVDKYAGNHKVAAEALLQLAGCQSKLGDAQARKSLERLVRDFADQKETVAEARVRLAGMGRSAAPGSGTISRVVWSGPSVQIDGSVSADGRYMSYIDAYNVALHDFVTNTDRRITSDAVQREQYAEPSSISKDGKHVAYAWRVARGPSELRVVSLETPGTPKPRTLASASNGIGVWGWSPDGKWVAANLFQGDGAIQLCLVSTQDGQPPRVLKTVSPGLIPARNVFFSPDGKYLGFDFGGNYSTKDKPAELDKRGVYVLAIDGGAETQAVSNSGRNSMVGWSPDGKRLLFASDGDLWAMPVADGKPQAAPELVKKGIVGTSLGVTATGALYLGSASGSTEIRVASVDLNTGRRLPQPLWPFRASVEYDSQPAWSPDGKYLAYSSSSFSPTRLVMSLAIRSIETGEVRQLQPQAPRSCSWPNWAPDGRSLVCVTGTGVIRVDAQTGEVTTIASSPAGFTYGLPQFSRDGKKIYYLKVPKGNETGDNGVIVERELSSAAERELAHGNVYGATLSPDGRYFAVVRSDRSTQSSVMMLIPASGGEARELFRTISPQRLGVDKEWTPDSRSLICWRMSGDTVNVLEAWMYPIDGGAPRKLDIDTSGVRVSANNPNPIRVHPNGREIAYVATTRANEVSVLENFLPAAKSAK